MEAALGPLKLIVVPAIAMGALYAGTAIYKRVAGNKPGAPPSFEKRRVNTTKHARAEPATSLLDTEGSVLLPWRPTGSGSTRAIGEDAPTPSAGSSASAAVASQAARPPSPQASEAGTQDGRSTRSAAAVNSAANGDEARAPQAHGGGLGGFDGWMNLVFVAILLFIFTNAVHNQLSLGSIFPDGGAFVWNALRWIPELGRDWAILGAVYFTFSLGYQYLVLYGGLRGAAALALQGLAEGGMLLGCCYYAALRAHDWPVTQRLGWLLETAVLVMKMHSWITVNRHLALEVAAGGPGTGAIVFQLEKLDAQAAAAAAAAAKAAEAQAAALAGGTTPSLGDEASSSSSGSAASATPAAPPSAPASRGGPRTKAHAAKGKATAASDGASSTGGTGASVLDDGVAVAPPQAGVRRRRSSQHRARGASDPASAAPSPLNTAAANALHPSLRVPLSAPAGAARLAGALPSLRASPLTGPDAAAVAAAVAAASSAASEAGGGWTQRDRDLAWEDVAALGASGDATSAAIFGVPEVAFFPPSASASVPSSAMAAGTAAAAAAGAAATIHGAGVPLSATSSCGRSSSAHGGESTSASSSASSVASPFSSASASSTSPAGAAGDGGAAAAQHLQRAAAYARLLLGKAIYGVNYEGKLTTTQIVAYPANVSAANLLHFSFAPTLCYEPSYPRTERIRPEYLAEKAFLALGLITALVLTVTRYVNPVLARVNCMSEWEAVVQLIVPLLSTMLLLFFLVWEAILNAFAEVTRFGARSFYGQWWNATTFAEWSRKWNSPVHMWLARHVYLAAMRQLGASPNGALTFTFLVSIAVHEVVVWGLLGKVTTPWLGLFSLLQLPLAKLQRVGFMKGTRLGNMVLWLGLSVGVALITALYAREVAGPCTEAPQAAA